MKPYFIIGLASEVPVTISPAVSSDTEQNVLTDTGTEKKTLRYALEQKIDEQIYVCVPLSEICELLKMEMSEFLEDEMLDALNIIKKRRGYPVIINL